MHVLVCAFAGFKSAFGLKYPIKLPCFPHSNLRGPGASRLSTRHFPSCHAVVEGYDPEVWMCTGCRTSPYLLRITAVDGMGAALLLLAIVNLSPRLS
jgi:hypothetical protein